MFGKFEFHIDNNPSRRDFEFYAVNIDKHGIKQAKRIEFESVESGYFVEPFLEIAYSDEGALQSLFDQLWNIGLRPKGYDDQGAVKATKDHLEDMRKIAFKFLELEK